VMWIGNVDWGYGLGWTCTYNSTLDLLATNAQSAYYAGMNGLISKVPMLSASRSPDDDGKAPQLSNIDTQSYCFLFHIELKPFVLFVEPRALFTLTGLTGLCTLLQVTSALTRMKL
jgi:hypothetical protein